VHRLVRRFYARFRRAAPVTELTTQGFPKEGTMSTPAPASHAREEVRGIVPKLIANGVFEEKKA